MGYNTWIKGEFTITPPLSTAHAAYLTAFADTRRMQRDPAKAETMLDPIRVAVELPLGRMRASLLMELAVSMGRSTTKL